MSQNTPLKNRCKNCGYVWYPRGHAISAQCPRCGSREVKLNWRPILAAAVGLAGVILYFILRGQGWF